MDSPQLPGNRIPKRSQLELQVQRTVAKYGMLQPGQHILVAVSGGADSVALLHVLRKIADHWRLSLSVAHFNHCLRGGESTADEQFVRSISSNLHLPFISEQANVRLMARDSRSNLEEMARQARYRFLRKTANQIGAHRIALGHNRNDQAETALMRYFRGSGPEGWAAIYPVVDQLVIRPLLECSRNSIVHYLEQRALSWRTDSSNDDLAYSRNRIRHELIPYLEECFNPKVVQTLAGQAEAARLITDYLQAQAQREYEAGKIIRPEGIELPVETVRALHPALRGLVVREFTRQSRGSLQGITSRHIQDILHLCEAGMSGRRIQLPGRCVAGRRFDHLFLSREAPASSDGYYYELPIPGRCEARDLGLEFVASFEQHEISPVSPAPETSRNTGRHHDPSGALIRLDAGALVKILVIRPRLPGDRYGGAGHRKVKKMLIDAKVRSDVRSRMPMLISGDAVIWMPGFRPAEAYRPRPDSTGEVVIVIRKC